MNKKNKGGLSCCICFLLLAAAPNRVSGSCALRYSFLEAPQTTTSPAPITATANKNRITITYTFGIALIPSSSRTQLRLWGSTWGSPWSPYSGENQMQSASKELHMLLGWRNCMALVPFLTLPLVINVAIARRMGCATSVHFSLSHGISPSEGVFY